MSYPIGILKMAELKASTTPDIVAELLARFTPLLAPQGGSRASSAQDAAAIPQGYAPADAARLMALPDADAVCKLIRLGKLKATNHGTRLRPRYTTTSEWIAEWRKANMVVVPDERRPLSSRLPKDRSGKRAA